jgi:NUMOD4 motif/HNH endonuclease/Sigma-70, region 4
MQNENEIFAPVIGFENRFKISNYGTLISINGKVKGERIIKGSIDTFGYRATTLWGNGEKWCVRIHTLVALHFVENSKPGEYDTVNHMDGNRLNNYAGNLEWCTRGENMAHAFRIGLVDKKGEKSHNAKLKEPQVLEMREKYKAGGYTQTRIGKEYGISRRHVSDILNRVCWAHI